MDNEQWDFWGSSPRLGWTTGTKERRQENNGSLSRGTPRLVAPSQIGILGEGGAERIPRNHSHCEFQQVTLVNLTLAYTEMDTSLHLSPVNPRTTLLIHSPSTTPPSFHFDSGGFFRYTECWDTTVVPLDMYTGYTGYTVTQNCSCASARC